MATPIDHLLAKLAEPNVKNGFGGRRASEDALSFDPVVARSATIGGW
jgi:hypothetical protein